MRKGKASRLKSPCESSLKEDANKTKLKIRTSCHSYDAVLSRRHIWFPCAHTSSDKIHLCTRYLQMMKEIKKSIQTQFCNKEE